MLQLASMALEFLINCCCCCVVPAILLTPVCPHSLSFRPIVVPSTVELKIRVPLDSRNCAWVSIDGRNRQKLERGDYVRITVSSFPVSGMAKSPCLTKRA